MTPRLRPLSVGEILDISFPLYRRHFVTLATVGLLCTGLPLLLSVYIEAAGGMLAQPAADARALRAAHGAELGGDRRDGLHRVGELSRPAARRRGPRSGAPRRSSAGSSSARSSSRSWSASASSALHSRHHPRRRLVLAFPALVLEPADPPRRAGPLLGAHPGLALADVRALVTLLILLYVPVVALGGGRGAGCCRPTPARQFGTGVADAGRASGWCRCSSTRFFYCVLTVAYYDLRVRKEGFDLELLASTLQPA